jgi:hypothetical protein
LAIVAAAYFDETLGRLLGDSKERSFHRRIEMALQFGLLTKDEGADLHTLGEIRNQFAHELHTRSFNPHVVAQIEAMWILRAALDAIPSRATVLPTPQDRLLYVVRIVITRAEIEALSATEELVTQIRRKACQLAVAGTLWP